MYHVSGGRAAGFDRWGVVGARCCADEGRGRDKEDDDRRRKGRDEDSSSRRRSRDRSSSRGRGRRERSRSRERKARSPPPRRSSPPRGGSRGRGARADSRSPAKARGGRDDSRERNGRQRSSGSDGGDKKKPRARHDEDSRSPEPRRKPANNDNKPGKGKYHFCTAAFCLSAVMLTGSCGWRGCIRRGQERQGR